MTATLFAQLEERAAVGFVADIVRGVLDKSRQRVRQRLECLIRAGSCRLTQSTDRAGWDWTRQNDPGRRAEADRDLPNRPI